MLHCLHCSYPSTMDEVGETECAECGSKLLVSKFHWELDDPPKEVLPPRKIETTRAAFEFTILYYLPCPLYWKWCLIVLCILEALMTVWFADPEGLKQKQKKKQEKRLRQKMIKRLCKLGWDGRETLYWPRTAPEFIRVSSEDCDWVNGINKSVLSLFCDILYPPTSGCTSNKKAII